MAQSREYLSIGEVLVALKPEFPDVTISKIRFLESEGLIEPERTASGYRKFYDRDVNRLRTILKLQRDEYLPLRVIRERLDGDGSEAPARVERAEDTDDDVPEPAPTLEMTGEELAAASGVDVDVIESLSSFGLLRPANSGDSATYGGDDLVVLRIVKDLFKFGVEPRHLTMYRHFADREATFFEQIVTPVLRQRNPEAQRQAAQSLVELSRI
ncbi:MAG TPA: MerR family transcriptional regulator, partial [Actinomycetota bacterium]|nr:MerR family transcriptional regulator [Actinomycetota bacterium]